MLACRNDLRNIAIIAHVDHGKTTLVDAMLWQSGAFRENQDVVERVMDSMDLEREKGITILAKNTAVPFGETRINIVDTPGHADFGGEVERALKMVDGVLLLVDATEGPLPQTRFVLRKALERRLPVVRDQQDRPQRRAAGRGRERDIRAVPRSRRGEFADRVSDRVRERARGSRRGIVAEELAPDLGPLFTTLLDAIPAPATTPNIRCRRLSPISTRALRRPARVVADPARDLRGRRANYVVPFRRDDPAGARHRAVHHRGARPRSTDEAGPGEIVALAGLPEVTIGETIADPDDPRPLPVTTIDEPSL